MKDFESLKNQGRIKSVRKDKAKARGLLKRSKKRMENQKERAITEKNAFEILENCYEALRECIEAGMSAEGLKSEDHVGTIAYANEKLGLEAGNLNKLHKFRKLRNKSRYEAKEIKRREAKQVIELGEEIMPEIREKVKGKL